LYPSALAQYEGLPNGEMLAEQDASMAAFRIMCITDLWFLCTEVYRMHEGKRGGRKIWYEDFHGPMVDFFELPDDALIWFTRNMLKSTVAEIYCVQQILADPTNVVLMLGSESMGLGRKKLLNIKRRLKHPKLIAAFPDRLIANENKWEMANQDGLTITRDVPDEEGGTREIPPSEPQIRIFGMDSAVTGDHPTHILFDDFITEKNTTTAVQIEKAIKKFEAVAGLRSLETITKLIGTPWHALDLYHHIIQNEIVDHIVQIAGVHMEGDREVIDYPWFTKDFLRKQKKMMRHLYWAQMHLDTRPKEDQLFKPPYRYWDELPKELEYYIGVDPSTGLTEEHDKAGITVGAVDPNNTSALYLIECDEYSLQAEELAELVLEKILRYTPNRVGIELGQQHALLTVIRLKAQEMQKSVAVVLPEFLEISTQGGTAGAHKWQKLDGTVGTMLRDQRIILSHGMEPLKLQMSLYDKNKQKNADDMLDSVRDCILAVPYFTYGTFDEHNEPVAKPMTWKDLVDSMKKETSSKERFFAN